MIFFPYYSYKISTSVGVKKIVDGLKQKVHLVDFTSDTSKPYFGFISLEHFRIKTVSPRGNGAAVITGRFEKLQKKSNSNDVLMKIRIRAHFGLYIVLGFFIPNLFIRLVNNMLTGSGSWFGYLVGILFLWIASTFIFSFYVRDFKRLMDDILKERNTNHEDS